MVKYLHVLSNILPNCWPSSFLSDSSLFLHNVAHGSLTKMMKRSGYFGVFLGFPEQDLTFVELEFFCQDKARSKTRVRSQLKPSQAQK